MTNRRFEDLLRETVRAPMRTPPPMIAMPLPERIGHYRIEARLGGGTNDVYRARDEVLGRVVALKVLAPFLDGDEARRARLYLDARSAAVLTHPNLVAIHEIAEASGRVCVAMELLSGETLDELLGARVPTLREALGIAHEIARGLAPAHHAGLVHRHLSTARVMVTGDGRVKVLGLGLAHGHDAPALARGERGDAAAAATDVLAMGLILRELTRSDAPPTVRALVGRCLERDPRARIPDGPTLARELACLVARVP